MMSQSPELASDPKPAAPEQHHQHQPDHATSARSTWIQVRRFIAEITEVFGSPAATLNTEPLVPLDAVSDHLDSCTAQLPYGAARVRSFVGASEPTDGDDSSTAAAAAAAAKPPVSAATESPGKWQLAAFARLHPLAVLVAAWATLVAADWLVTSAVVPRMVALLTARLWLPLAEATVAGADDGGTWLGLMLRRLLSGNLWLDDVLWRVQLLAADALEPLARPLALQWLCLALLSARIMRRCSRIGARALLLCSLYFAASDFALWSIFGPSALGGASADLLLPSRTTHMCTTTAGSAGAALATPATTNHAMGAPPLPQNTESLSDVGVVEEARRRALEERRRAQMRSLEERRKRQSSWDGDRAGSRVLPLLATLAVHTSVVFRVRHLDRAAGRLCVALLALGVVLRGSAGCVLAWPAARTVPGAGLLVCMTRASFAVLARVGGHACLLPIHALSTFGLLALRELAFAVHSMRAWYATTIRDRRWGPAMVGARLPSGSAIVLTSALAPVEPHVPMPDHAGPVAPSVCTNGDGERRTLTLSQVTGRARAPYAHRVCFLCLSGFCERCLLSMKIWPTAPADASPGSSSPTATSDRLDAPGDSSTAISTALQAPAILATSTAAHARRRGRTRHAKSASSAPLPAGDPGNGLPPLGESLLSLGLLSPDASTSAAAGQSRRGKLTEAWIASSVAHCPCRAVHGVGPSSFVSRAAKIEYMQQARATGEPSAFATPRGTLVSLPQYVSELRSLGLVRPVDPASVVFADEDPTSSVLPLIFGRFTVPANPGAVSAANALLASSATSYSQLVQQQQQQQQPQNYHSGHTPGSAPFLGPASAVDAPGGSASRSRILPKPTPLSLARASVAGTFRLCVEDICALAGAVRLHVVVTPILAHLLLTHPRTTQTAAVCVPASLAGVIASRMRPVAPNQPPQQQQQQGIAAATSGVADADPFLDHVRVQVARTDVVVRVNGQRWTEAEVGWALNETIEVRGLAVNSAYRICLSVCGMRSEELAVVLPSAQAAVSQARLAKQREREEAMAQLEDAHRQQLAAQQQLKRTRRDAPKQIHHWHAELDALHRAVDRSTQVDTRSHHRYTQLQGTIAESNAELAQIRAQREQQQGSDESYLSSSADESNSPTSADLRPPAASGFGVLSRLSDTSGAPAGRPTRSGTGNGISNGIGGTGSSSKLALDKAAAALRQAEQQAKETRDALEDAVQELKAERARWMDKLAQATQQQQPLLRAIEPVRRDVAETTKRLASGKIAAARLRRQLSDLDRQIAGLNSSSSSSAGEVPGGGGAAASVDGLQAQLIRRVAALREAIRAEHAGQGRAADAGS
ncbi:hypothetical protein LPJ61_002654 [Coemansia biformis]|uniref:Uncharacterized protein n=1 Tax=Coemansia biformis TaxID=1286918 RepID=A0A9W7YE38_9FUNG|nr:hypothetical protein LPJ61_002654 [Coemansia biformis]